MSTEPRYGDALLVPAPGAKGDEGSSRTRLCIAAVNFYPVYAGPGERFRRYLPGFRSRGLDVSVCTGTPDASRGAACDLPEHWREVSDGHALPVVEVDGVPVHRFKLPDKLGLRREARFAWSISGRCADASARPGVIQLFSSSPATVPGLLRMRRFGVPTVLTYTMMPAFAGNPMKISALRGAARLVSRSVACIVTSSNAMRSALRDLNIQTRVEVIPNGVDMNRFRPPIDEAERVDARRRLGISRDASVLLFIGPVAPRKRIDLLLEAWCRLAPTRSDLHLVIAGPRLDMTRPHWADFHRRLETLIDRSGARERVHFLGLIEDVEDTLRAADLFVFTSSREGMPNVVAEAMASGVPVVTTPFIGLPEEFGKPGQQFRLTDFSGEGIAKDVSELLADAGRRSELARNARSWIADHLELGSSLDLYAQLYHDLGRRS